MPEAPGSEAPMQEEPMNEAADLPEFLTQRVSEAYAPDVAREVFDGLRAANERPVTFRANTLKASAEEVASALAEAGIAAEPVPWYPDAFVASGIRERELWGLDIYRAGGIYLQSLSSMLPPLVLKPRPRADVLDMCAAPGGKTSQLSALSGGEARIMACELNAPRAEKLEYNLAKMGVRNTQVLRTDARRLDEFFSFDQVLLDAPCTGTGTVRAGDERAGKRITPQLLAKVTKSQAALLDRGLTVLKPGCTLIYSTCSILPAENEDIVRAALKRHKDCELAPIALPDGALEAIPRLPCRLEEGALTVRPTRLFEGFFLAAIKKQARARR